MVREIVLDTETTGIDPLDGHRIIEIGCVELMNHVPTGKTLQLFINPERDVPPEAVAVHGIIEEFLKDKPVFSQTYTEFMDFLNGDTLVIHNAELDMKFINWELKQVGHKPYDNNKVIDTLKMARKKFPGSPASLDALCRRFGIDNTERTYHGALLDSELLAEVYLELLGGRQHGFSLSSEVKSQQDLQMGNIVSVERPYREPRAHAPSKEELENHAAMLEKLNDPLWLKSEKKG